MLEAMQNINKRKGTAVDAFNFDHNIKMKFKEYLLKKTEKKTTIPINNERPPP